ncbi:I78 family peptidase inhibitor [Amaricoccus sp.]|uniref:I78 family peptidase inhibitor n=1 Tax=Amaricoccus sp. TaxID=1872485 RepID=UPI00262C3BD0|nr:I78 family peptidase inhibitor [uncultured Amaricoccus sp.]
MSRPIHFAGLALAVVLALGACDKLKSAGETVEGDAKAVETKVVDGDGACGAPAHQNLVGTGAGALDPGALPAGTRVIFPGMPVTMDYRAERMNVEIGAGDKVARVFCG